MDCVILPPVYVYNTICIFVLAVVVQEHKKQESVTTKKLTCTVYV